MKACATWTSFVALVTTALVTFSACGGGAQTEPPPASPESPAESPPPESTPAADPPTAPSDQAAGASTEEAPADLGEGDSRTTETIAAIVKENRKKARDCYEKALKQVSGLKGDLVIHFTLTPAGKVKQAEVNKERSTINEPGVVSCVIDVIRSLEFPKSSKGLETTVNYPFNFNP